MIPAPRPTAALSAPGLAPPRACIKAHRPRPTPCATTCNARIAAKCTARSHACHMRSHTHIQRRTRTHATDINNRPLQRRQNSKRTTDARRQTSKNGTRRDLSSTTVLQEPTQARAHAMAHALKYQGAGNPPPGDRPRPGRKCRQRAASAGQAPQWPPGNAQQPPIVPRRHLSHPQPHPLPPPRAIQTVQHRRERRPSGRGAAAMQNVLPSSPPTPPPPPLRS